MQKTHEIEIQCCAWQHFYSYRRKTLPPRYQNCLLGELFQCLRFTRSSSELNSSNRQNRSGRGVTALRAPRESQPSPPRLGQPLSHICDPRKGTAEQQEPAASPKGCQSMGEHATARLQTEGCASSNKGVPSLTANFPTEKVRKESKRRNCILEK